MKPLLRGGAVLAVVVSVCAALIRAEEPGRDAVPPAPAALPAETAMAALIRANGGKVPATGEQLWVALRKLGTFGQLPVPFSAVRLNSGLGTPRVVIAPLGPGPDGVTDPNVDGRLFLAANMERQAEGGPRVATVEFISWNPARRRFDFGVIEGMGVTGEPRLSVVDAGRCFACHKNRGPILGVRPWSNTAQDDILRFATASGLRIGGAALPQTGPFALPWSRPGAPVTARDRIDGMALATPQGAEVDAAVRRGAALRTNRDAFRLMTRTPDGRKALVMLLAAVTDAGPLDAIDRKVRATLDTTFSPSFDRYATDWVDLQKAAKPSALLDADPASLLVASGVRPPSRSGFRTVTAAVAVPGLLGGNGSLWAAPPGVRGASGPRPGRGQSIDPVAVAAAVQAAQARQAAATFAATLAELARYDAARAAGSHGLTSKFQPSNPKAFTPTPVTRPKRASTVVTPTLLAATIGLTDGDRRFLAQSLADAAGRVKKPTATPAVLATGVFEGGQFADVLAGGPLPDRDEFKDRFVTGLDELLRVRYGIADGFAPDRGTYASGPRYDPAAAEEREVAVVPTTACLRCHEVGRAPAARFDPIPPLAFDPFDPAGRAAWLRAAAADPKRKREVLARMVERVSTDADMPPEDAPERDRFRVKEAAAFDEVTRFLTAELRKAGGR